MEIHVFNFQIQINPINFQFILKSPRIQLPSLCQIFQNFLLFQNKDCILLYVFEALDTQITDITNPGNNRKKYKYFAVQI